MRISKIKEWGCEVTKALQNALQTVTEDMSKTVETSNLCPRFSFHPAPHFCFLGRTTFLLVNFCFINVYYIIRRLMSLCYLEIRVFLSDDLIIVCGKNSLRSDLGA